MRAVLLAASDTFSKTFVFVVDSLGIAELDVSVIMFDLCTAVDLGWSGYRGRACADHTLGYCVVECKLFEV
jgi:hypothetical protein